jgi:hypothetical protein
MENTIKLIQGFFKVEPIGDGAHKLRIKGKKGWRPLSGLYTLVSGDGVEYIFSKIVEPKTNRVSWVWYEMARRRVKFHHGEEWQNIRLWGLFTRSSIKT